MSLFDRSHAEALIREAESRKRLYSGLFAQQQGVLRDESRYIALCCSRRAGKTHLLARLIVRALRRCQRNEWVVYGARTLGVAKNLIWTELAYLIHSLGLNWTLKEHEGSITTDKGAHFRLIGVDDSKSIEKVRGNKYRLVVLDEASTYQEYLASLITSSFSPGLVDIAGSQLILSGTPGYICTGYWYEACTGTLPSYARHSWTLRDNPNLTDVESFLAEQRAANHWTVDDPVYVREYLGQWVNDDSSLVFSYSPVCNAVNTLPQPFDPATWLVTVGVDFGYTDDTAWVVLGSPLHSQDIYVLHAEKHTQLLPDEAASITKSIYDTYRPTKIIGDGGGSGKTYLEEFNRRHAQKVGITITPTNKQVDIPGSIALMNGSLRSDHVKLLLPQAKPLADEITYLPWLDTAKTKVHPAYANHASDAFRYAYQVHRSHYHKPATPKKDPHDMGTAEERFKARLRKAASPDWMY